MKTLPILMILVLGFGCAQQHPVTPPFDLPPGVTYETDENIEFHSFRWGTNETTALFMMSPHPAGLSYAMVDKMIEDARPMVIQAMREVEGVDEVDTTTRNITAGDFTGKAIVCELGMADGKTVRQTMHIVWDGNRLWQGQLTGTTEDDLKTVETILKSKTRDLRTSR